MTIKRLFDCLDHQLQHFPKKDMLAAKENGQWVMYGTQQVADIVNRFSAGLMKLGLSGNDMTATGSDKIAIISNNRPEWLFTDLAAQQLGVILVPVYPTTNPLELAFILNDSAVKYIFVSNDELLQKVNGLLDKVPSIKTVYTFDKIAGAAHWSEITAMADEKSLQQVALIKPTIPVSHLATIIYTSGTTGTPKGVMLSHKNIYTNV
ncbi:MAG: O-succinylbenzoic acid--CoA ligase, partial [Sediminibacterium sp.]|nr:O-succinylbenzoic acid--CoA ligase [Sediminibacterium sp.]